MVLKSYLVILYFFSLIFVACEQNPQFKESQAKVSNSGDSEYHILIFKAEKILEIWKINEKNDLVNSFDFENVDFPIGEFDLSFDESKEAFKIKFPNDYAKYFLGGYKAGIIGIPT